MSKKRLFKFEHYPSIMHVSNIEIRYFDKEIKNGWEPISFAQTQHGMTVLFKRSIK